MLAILLLAYLSGASAKSRIVNGWDVEITDHPHQISWVTSTGSHSCGGSIIADNWVLTAAHCIGSNNRVVINNGYLNDPSRTTIAVQEIIVHPSYGSGGGQAAFPNDIALVRTRDSLTAGSGRKGSVISLAEANDNFDGQNCMITGWGRLTGGGSLPNKLQGTTGLILTNSQCSSSWGNSYNGNYHICIHDTYSGACNGDSGGPLVCTKNGQDVLAGVTSWGRSNCVTSYPSVYARVSSYRSWIDGIINN